MHECVVAIVEGRLAGFAVARHIAADEIEILNIGVDPPFRQRGIGRSLVCELIGKNPGTVFLEVRQSNIAARKLYHSLGFEVAGVRQDYYSQPVESAIVMKFHSC
jgi:ribosomal-protein-alanine N-acetyltransferase